jgi:hypothetical protein
MGRTGLVLSNRHFMSASVCFFAALIFAVGMPDVEGKCPRTLQLNGTCPEVTAETHSDSVDVKATQMGTPGNSGSDSGSDKQGSRPIGSAPGPGGNPAERSDQLYEWDPDAYVPTMLPDGTEYTGDPIPVTRGGWVPIEPTILSREPFVTVDDLANFRPAAGTLHMEPDGWTVVGLTTNFWIYVAANTHTGELLEAPASVRFTPVGYTFSYGDSDAYSGTNPGDTWSSQRLDEFDPAPTGHIFTESGTYDIAGSVEYSAEYQFDGEPWRPIVGTVRIPTNTLSVVAARARTVLVNDNCITAPNGPGC